MTPIWWGWCGCTVWPMAIGYQQGRCGKCKRAPVFVADESISREEAERMVAQGLVAWAW